MKSALILGVSGQDGAYLSKLLLDKGYHVFGSSRDAQVNAFSGLKELAIFDHIEKISINPRDFRSFYSAIKKIKPEEIYNLSGQSSVGLSFEQPVETFESVSGAVLNILECIRMSDHQMRFYNAGSSEMFGDTPREGANENMVLNPKSPYAIAKASAYWQVCNYRDAYGLHCSTGILFNHESPLRPDRYVTKKIVKGAINIQQGKSKSLSLGNLKIFRDWGWAPEYVEAMWKMVRADQAKDYVISTGISSSLEYFVKKTFACLDLNWEEYVTVDEKLLRPSDILFSKGDSTKAIQELGWKPEFSVDKVIEKMIEYELKKN